MEFEEIGWAWGRRPIYRVKSSQILHTYIGFGVIDRGTNVLQVRPTTICPLNCIFCSVDAGPYSRNRWAEFIVEQDTIVSSVLEIARFKGGGVEALIDTIGEPLTYPQLHVLVKKLKKDPLVKTVAIETHGELLSKEVVDKLEESGLDRVNLSIETLNPEKAKIIQGVRWYDVSKVARIAEYIARETSIDIHVTPVWIPGLNDEDVVKVIEWAYRIGAGKKWPPATIQKYVVHKYGRRVEGVKPLSWSNYWRWIDKFEKKHGFRVHWSMDEWGMARKKKYPCPYRVGDKLVVKIVSRGVFRGEYIGLPPNREAIIAVAGRSVDMNREYLVEIIQDKDCLLIAKPIKPIHT